MCAPVAQVVRAPGQRTGELWFKPQLGYKYLRSGAPTNWATGISIRKPQILPSFFSVFLEIILLYSLNIYHQFPWSFHLWVPVAAGDKNNECATPWIYGQVSLSDRALSYGLDGQDSILDGGGVQIFTLICAQIGPGFHSASGKMSTGGVNTVKCRASHPTSWRRGCKYVDPCIHILLGPSWPLVGISLPLYLKYT